jgi:hypothetical protein
MRWLVMAGAGGSTQPVLGEAQRRQCCHWHSKNQQNLVGKKMG